MNTCFMNGIADRGVLLLGNVLFCLHCLLNVVCFKVGTQPGELCLLLLLALRYSLLSDRWCKGGAVFLSE